MKKLRYLLLVLFIVPCFLLSGCITGSTNITIEKTGELDDCYVYTLTMPNGSTSTFTVEKSKDGEDGKDFDWDSIVDYCEEHDIEIKDFLQEYYNVTFESEYTVKSATNKAIQSAVSVWSELDSGTQAGAGVIYKIDKDDNGNYKQDGYSYIITNYHVVYSYTSKNKDYIAEEITVFQYGTSEPSFDNQIGVDNAYGGVSATYIGGSLVYDLAVLQVSTADLLKYNPAVKEITVASDYEVGETCIAIGNPKGDGLSVTSGIVSKYSEIIYLTPADTSMGAIKFRVLRTDAAINGGNSGGGLFNIKGEYIGTVNSKVTEDEYVNMAFALPVTNTIKVVDNILDQYKASQTTGIRAKRLFLGVTTYGEKFSQEYDEDTDTSTLTSSCLVYTVNAGDFGYLMGLQSGDYIKGITIQHTTGKTESYDVKNYYEVSDIMFTVRTGDAIVITVDRNDVSTILTKTVSATDLEYIDGEKAIG